MTRSSTTARLQEKGLANGQRKRSFVTMLYKELTESLPLQHFDVKEHFVPASHIREYPGATIGSQEEVLYNHVKQYVPKAPIKDEKNAVTFICSMGVGLPKVGWRPGAG